MGKKSTATSSTSKSIGTHLATNDNKKQPNLNDTVNQLVAQAIALWKKKYQLEIEILRAEVIEIKKSQAFMCSDFVSFLSQYRTRIFQ